MGTLALRSQYRQLQRSPQLYNKQPWLPSSTPPSTLTRSTRTLLSRPCRGRARINKCLDELKDLMVFAIQSEGDAINKLEKADVLELTVQHLQFGTDLMSHLGSGLTKATSTSPLSVNTVSTS